ncbi:MAG: glutamine-hydrolyzing carbamoyl-phosphate synthase small subunit [Saprospiraceae bacterium]|nr:glutamine-hydrolyzing carbamoyl-phosphate synthase small subunit [Saprospiraceae bacterium]
MDESTATKAVLLLEDGTVFHGNSAGKIGTTSGEICFNTGMTGYQEIFTDPSYFGQILVATNAHIGNYGIKSQEVESDTIKISGFICKNFTNEYSRAIADESINEYFVRENLVAISDVDTRAIVRHIRDKGAMNAIVSSEIFDLDELAQQLQKVPSMKGLELASQVSTDQSYFLGDASSSIYRVAVYDYGVKKNILRCLVDRGCYLQVYPAKTPFDTVREWNPDGYFISNGPGDPEPMRYAVESTRRILEENKPLFGICLGHQILGLALGVTTYKMHHGHRGINHPVKNLQTGKCEITSQNHGFGVDPDSIRQLSDKIEITHLNLNDGSIEGMKICDKDAFSVQYHPEASPGPHDARYLFDQFINYMKIRKPEKVTDEQHS